MSHAEISMQPYGGLPPHEDTGTSLAAAHSMADAAPSIRARVYAEIDGSGMLGITDDELEMTLRMRHQTVSARRRELVLLGLVQDSGCVRKTRSGRKATVWISHHTPIQAKLL